MVIALLRNIALFMVSRSIKKAFLNWLCQDLSFVDIFFNRFFPVWKCGVTPHCLYRDSLTLREEIFEEEIFAEDIFGEIIFAI